MSETKAQIGLFFGSTTCYTEMAAEKIQAALGHELVDLFNIKDVPLSRTQDYPILILGISTWDFGELQEDWESQWQDISQVNLEGKVIAIFGLGDQVGYADWYQDALGMLHDEVNLQQCHIIGYCTNQGHEFNASKALTEDKGYFVGLPLDDENQYDQTDERIENWCNQLLTEIEQVLS